MSGPQDDGIALAGRAGAHAAAAPRRLPLTPPQREVWLAAQLGDDASCAFNESISVALSGPLSVAALRRALAALVERHDALRVTFDPDGEAQTVGAPFEPKLPDLDLSLLPEAEHRARVEELLEEEGLQPFDLAAGPLVRFQLVRLAAEDHVLVLTAHHLVCDGLSTNVLLKELGSLYAEASVGAGTALPAPTPLADYVGFETGPGRVAAAARDAEHFAALLTPAPPPLELPTDRPRPAERRYEGATVSRTIPGDLSRAVRRAGAGQGCTLFATLLAAFTTLLHRLSGQDDLVVGIPSAGQLASGHDELVGHGVHFLPLRSRLAAETAFADHLRETRRALLQGAEHQATTLGAILPRLALPRLPGRMPLVEVEFNVERIGAGLRMPSLAVSVRTNPKRSVLADLFLNVVETDDGLVLECEFSSALFDADTVARWLAHYETLLAAVAAEPEAKVSGLPLLTAAERAAAVAAAQGPALTRPRESVAAAVLAAARRDPDAPAVVAGGRVLTYGALAAHAAALASRIAARGVSPGALVGLCAPRSAELCVGALAAFLARVAYLPLDPALPPARLASEALAAGVALVLAAPESLAVAPALELLVIDAGGRRDAAAPPDPRAPLPAPGDLAYVITTSGSTGESKGVEVTHASLANLVAWHRSAYALGPGERTTLLASPGFDASVWELWGALATGATLVVPDEEARLAPERLVETWARERITISFLPTPLAERVLALPMPEELALRALLVGGEALHAAPRAKLPFALVNHYGPAEATVVATACEVAPASAGAPPIGRPIANVAAYVLDARGEPVPAGVPGELVLGGAGVARGYRGRPELTAERFVPDHLGGGGEEARLYHTGDRARWRPDGALEYLGRLDRQVKLRGVRIEPAEVEAALAALPGVREATVLPVEEKGRAARLVGYVAPTAAEIEETERRFLDVMEGRWDDRYASAAAAERSDRRDDPSLALYRSTGHGGAEADAQERMARTAASVRALAPRRVLEIGCGTGLLFERLLPGLEAATAADASPRALESLRARLGAEPGVHLARRRAEEVDELPGAPFDVVVLHSVVEYFPGVDYLLRVLARAVEVTAPGGAIVLGGVPSLPLLSPFLFGRELLAAEEGTSGAEVAERAERARALATPLAIHPDLLRLLPRRLPRVTHVELAIPPGAWRDPETRLHADTVCDVTLRLDAPPPDAAAALWREDEGAPPETFRRLLSEERPAALGVAGVASPRLALLVRAGREGRGAAPTEVAALRRALAGTRDERLESLRAAADGLPYDVTTSWSDTGEDALCDVVFVKRTGGPRPAVPSRPRPVVRLRRREDHATHPARALLHRSLVPRLVEALRASLPEPMVPSAFVLVDRLPLTPAGKVDRRALPRAADEARAAGPVSPRTGSEARLLDIVREVLSVPSAGVLDDVFELGADSLLVFSIAARARKAGLPLTLKQFFERRTVAALCRDLAAAPERSEAAR